MKPFARTHPAGPGRGSPVLALAVAAAVAACSGGDDRGEEPAVRVDTVNGVAHVRNGSAPGWDRPWTLDTAATVEIGELDGPDERVFGEIAGVLVDGRGRIHVADAQALEVRAFDADGAFLYAVGRDGEGPGEFRNISGVGRGPAGGLAVLDGRLARVSVFDGEAFVRSFAIDRPFMILEHGASVRFDDDGRFFDRTQLSIGLDVDTAGVVVYDTAGGVMDTVLTSVREPRRFMITRDGRPVMSMAVPFEPRPSAAVGPAGRIYVTTGAAYEIAALGPDGDTLRVIHRDVDPVAVAAAERDSVVEALRERYREVAGSEPRDLPELPDHKPAVTGLRVDDAGFLWVQRPPAPSVGSPRWDVFDRDGRFQGTLEVPDIVVMHIGERAIAGVARDELGVGRVRVIPLDRGA